MRDCLEAVRHGEEVIITERGRPVARIVPAGVSPEPEAGAETGAGQERGFRKRRPGPIDMPIGRKGGVVLSALLE